MVLKKTPFLSSQSAQEIRVTLKVREKEKEISSTTRVALINEKINLARDTFKLRNGRKYRLKYFNLLVWII